VPALAVLYDYAWFVGAGGAALSYYALMLPTKAALRRVSVPPTEVGGSKHP
jgi:cytosine/uracil/thiamine/allantoin permease